MYMIDEQTEHEDAKIPLYIITVNSSHVEEHQPRVL